MQLRLDEARTLSELLDTLEAYVEQHPSAPDTWLEAIGWDQTRWSDTDGSFPTAVRRPTRPVPAPHLLTSTFSPLHHRSEQRP